MAVILKADAELATHIAIALSRHRKWLARQGIRPPEGLVEVEQTFTSSAREGQGGTALDEPWEFSEPRVMPPQLLSYETAADVLSVSVRTVKRLVAAGELTPVAIGGTARLRASDLEAYVAALPARDHVTRPCGAPVGGAVDLEEIR